MTDGSLAAGDGRPDRPAYSVVAIPGDGVGPEVVGHARTVLDAAGSGLRLRDRLGGDPRRRHRDRHVRVGDPPGGRRAVRSRRRRPSRRGRRPALGRSERQGPPGAGTLRPAWRPRPLRQPPPGDRPPGARAIVAAPARAARGSRPAHRPRADRRHLLRPAVAKSGRRPTARDRRRHAVVRGVGDPADRPPRLRAGSDPAVEGDPGRQGQRPRLEPAVAQGHRGGPCRLPRRRARAPPRRLDGDAARDPAVVVRRRRHREPLRRHPLRRGGRPGRLARDAAVRLAR